MEQSNEKSRLISSSWSQISLHIDSNIESTSSRGGYDNVRNGPQIVAALIACLGSLSLGIALGYSSPAIPDLEAIFELNASEISWFGSLVTLGAAIGALLSGLLIELFGRKSTLLVANLPLVVGYAIIGGVKTMTWLYIGRTLTGVGVGMMAVTVNVYIAEISTVKMRGILATISQLFVASGIFIAYLLGIPLVYKWIALFGAGVAFIMVSLVLFIPETPRWNIKKGKHMAATKALLWLRGPQANIGEEIKEIELNIAGQPGKMNICDIFTPRYLKPLFLCLMIHVLQKFSGINAIDFYTESIFQSAGFDKNADIPPVVVSLVAIVGSLPPVLLVDKLGRKPMLISSGFLNCISCFTLGLFYYLYEEQNMTNISWLPIVSLVVYGFGFSMGWGPVAWLVANEIIPLRIRGFGSGLASVVNWTIAFLITKEFPVLVEVTSHYVGFWIFSGMSFLAILFVIFFIPETKGKSLEQIEQYFIPSTKGKKNYIPIHS